MKANIRAETRLCRPLAVVCLILVLECWSSLRAAAPPLTWLWSNPQPHGNNVYDLATTNGLTISVGDRGQVHTSLSDDLWVPRQMATTKAARAVTVLGSCAIITGEAGLAAYAELSALRDDMTAPLTVLDLGTANWLEGVASGNSRAVAVGDNGAVYTTPDGMAWTLRPASFSTWLRGVGFGNNLFVAVGDAGMLATSSDGVAWQKRNSGTSADLNRVAWLGDRFIAVGSDGQILSSNNGSNWNAVTGSQATGDLYAVAGTSSMYVVGGEGELRMRRPSGWSDEIRSAFLPAPAWTYYAGAYDGASFLFGGPTGMLVSGFYTNQVGGVWTELGDSLRLWLWDMASLPGGGYVAVGDYGAILTSDEGTRWNVELTPTAATNVVLLGVAARSDRLVAVGTQGTILTSTNGVIWSAVAAKPTIQDLQGVAAWPGGFVATGDAGTVLTSPDGSNWLAQPAAGSAFLSSVAAHPGGLVAVGTRGTLVTSTDAVTWTAANLATTNWLYRVRYLAGQLVVVGEAGSIYTSPDAQDWTPRNSGTANWLNDVAAFAGRFYAVGTRGTVLSSADGVTWESETCISQKSLYAAAAEARQMVVAGIEGVILRAQPSELVIQEYQHESGTNRFRLTTRPGRRVRLESTPELGQVPFAESATAQSLDYSGEIVLDLSTNSPPARQFFRGRLVP